MSSSKNLFGMAALLALLVAGVYIASAAMAGFAPLPLVCGVLWLVLAGGLKRNMRWLSYLGFLFALAGTIAVYATSGTLPAWLTTALIAANIAMALVLFTIVWRSPPKIITAPAD